MQDLAIRNGLVVTPSGLIRGGLTARDGKITQVGSDNSLPKARLEVDAEGNYLLPGIIDTHVHLAHVHPEDEFVPQLREESGAAAIGGITTLITTTVGLVHTDPTVPRVDLQRRHKKEGVHNSFVDFKITHWMYTPGHLDEVEALFKEGCTSFKFIFFVAGATRLEQLDWGFAYRGFRKIAKLGGQCIVTLHAEQPDIIAFLQQELMGQGRTDLMAWTDARPAICETIDVLTAGLIGLEVGCPVYIVHVSAWQSIEAIKFLRQMGAKIYAETTPHYLALTKYEPLGIGGVVKPPLRDETHVARLWQAVADGTIDTIGSDHVPIKLQVDKLERGLWKCQGGLPGMGVILPIMVNEGVNRGRITMEQLAKVSSENAARIFGIYPKKGVLSPGSDADIIIVDQHKEWTIGVDTLKGLSDYSPYEGKVVRGKAIKTFVRGRLVAEDGRLVTESPLGEFVEPCF